MRSWVLKKCQKPLRPIAVPIAGYCLQTTARLPGQGDAYSAYYRLESMEYYANILMLTGKIIGRQNTLTDEQIERLVAMREKFGMQ